MLIFYLNWSRSFQEPWIKDHFKWNGSNRSIDRGFWIISWTAGGSRIIEKLMHSFFRALPNNDIRDFRRLELKFDLTISHRGCDSKCQWQINDSGSSLLPNGHNSFFGVKVDNSDFFGSSNPKLAKNGGSRSSKIVLILPNGKARGSPIVLWFRPIRSRDDDDKQLIKEYSEE